METIYTRVKARILDLYPESAGRWTDTFLTPVMQVVDGIVRERAELSWSEQTITPVAGALYYALNSSAIWVGAVLFSLDGSNFKDGELTQTTFAELDEADPRWQDKTANEPRHYLLLSQPGVPDYSKLMLWPAMTTVGTERILVRYLSGFAGFSPSDPGYSEVAERWLIDSIYVPLTMAFLLGRIYPKMAAEQFAKAAIEMPRAYGRYQSKYGDWYAPWNLNDHRLGTG